MLTLADPIEHARSCFGDRVALIDDERSFTFAQLADRCRRLAGGLATLGVQHGDRVALLSANGHRYLEAFFGIPAAGIVLVPLNTRLAPAELDHIVQHSGARVLITDRDSGEIESLVEHVVRIPDDYEKMLEGAASRSIVASAAVSDVAALFYTGGTTGLPKGVMLTHGNLVANAFNKILACSLGPDDVFLGAPAMFHVAGIAPLTGLAQFYGATETSSVVTRLRHEEATLGTDLAGSCGQPAVGVAVRTVRPDGTDCEVGEVGEVLARSNAVMAGYWNNPVATAEALRDGWYHTGDLGYLNDRQYLFVVDRTKDMIVSGAENVYSVEVEDALYRHPAVCEAAVFGIPDATWGEAVYAVVAYPGATVTADQLRAHCRDLIAGYKVPKVIEIATDPLPKSGPGKILKRILRDCHLAE